MFFQNKLSINQIQEIAAATGVNPVAIAIRENGFADSFAFWDKPEEINSGNDRFPLISLGGDNLVYEYAKAKAESVQFPVSSAYAHFIGCMSAAMLGRFWVDYHGEEQPTALYMVISQPPSTGKSAINSAAINPMRAEIDRINEKRKAERSRLAGELRKIEKEIKNDVKGNSMVALYEEKEKIEERLKKAANVVFAVSDPTPEGLAKVAAVQGNFSVISDEATAINTLLGLTYGGTDKKSNSELILKAWDMNHMEVARSNQDNNLSLRPVGAICVIAQDETIKGIMDAGQRGIGVSERFLLVREEPRLGTRILCDENGDAIYKAVDKALVSKYYRLVHNVMSEEKVVFSLSLHATRALNLARQDMEASFAAGGKYSHSMLRGHLGKFDKHVIRIASVIHTIKYWAGEKPNRANREIDLDTMQEAIMTFNELSKTYLSSANAAGFAGDEAESRKLIDVVTDIAKKNKGRAQIQSVIAKCRNVTPFNGQQKVAERIETLLETLENMNYVCRVDDNIYINPRLM